MDKELANLTISHENEEKLLSTQLDVEAKIQIESLSNAINNLMTEEIKKIGLECVTEVRWYRIAGKFCMVQNFMVFVDRLTTVKIRTMKFSILI